MSGPNLTTIDGLWWDASVTSGTSTLSVNIRNNSSLTTISRIYQLVTGSVNVGRTIIYDFSGNALSQASVDALLVAIDAGKGTDTGTRQVDLSGGTNSTPGAAGLAAKASLVAAGWVVTNN